MNSYIELLDTWRRSTSVMHIAHHKAAAKCTKAHNLLGVVVAILGAAVASSVFVAASKNDNQFYLLITAVVLAFPLLY